MILIRKLDLNELQIIQVLAKKIWPVSFRDMISSEQIDYMLEWMYNMDTLEENYRKGHVYSLYSKNNKAIAFVSHEIIASKSTIRIHKLYVNPDYQKKGIGRLLYTYIYDIGASAKLNSLELYVNRTNPAVEFYKSIGFEIVEEVDLDIGNGFFMNDYLMKIKI